MLRWDDFHSNTSYDFMSDPLFSGNDWFGLYTSFLSYLISWSMLMKSTALQCQIMQQELKLKMIAAIVDFGRLTSKHPLPHIFQLQRNMGSLFQPSNYVFSVYHQILMLWLPGRRSTYTRSLLWPIPRKHHVMASWTPGSIVCNMQMRFHMHVPAIWAIPWAIHGLIISSVITMTRLHRVGRVLALQQFWWKHVNTHRY